VYGQGYLYIDSSIISQNTGFDGGGIQFSGGVLTISNSTIADNTVTDSSGTGGINCDNGTTLTLVNSTIADNSGYVAGGIKADQSPVTITDSTISGNTATDGTGGLMFAASNTYGSKPYIGPPAVNGTIISGNSGGDLYASLYTDVQCGVTGADNLIGGSGLLAPLGNYGGVTAGADNYGQTPQTLETMALLPGSPALDAGGNFGDAVGNTIGSDERGISRPTSGADIGAFQSQGFNVAITAGNYQNAAINSPFAGPLSVQVTSNDPNLANLDGGVITFIAPSTGQTALLGTNQLISDSVTLVGANTASESATADDVNGSYTVTASATPYGTSSSTGFSLTNTGTPSEGLPTLSITGPTSATGDLSYTLTLQTSDSSQDIPLNWTIHWGDGESSTTGQNNNALSTVSHTFATAPGNFTIFATATDMHGNIYVAGTWQVSEDEEGAEPPGPVTGQAASTGQVDLTWNSVAGAQYYEVFRGTIPTFTPSYYNEVGDAVIATSFADNGVSRGTDYYYKVYSVDSAGTSTLVGKSSVATPAADVPIDPGIGPGSTPSGAPVALQAIGVNDLEIFVSWTCTARNLEGFQVQISADGINWGDAGTASAPDLTASQSPYVGNFIVRTGPDGSSLLNENQPYYFRVRSFNSGYQSDWSYDMSPTKVITPSVDVGAGTDTLVILGGNRQPLSYLLQGVYVGVGGTLQGATDQNNSVGAIWVHDVNEGYNAFLTADPADGGAPAGYGGMPLPGAVPAYEDVINNSGGGLLYSEIETELNRGYYDLGFISYSHGVGIMQNLDFLIKYSQATPSLTQLIFSGTIDGVQYGTGPDSTKPRDGYYVGIGAPVYDAESVLWPGAICVNYWEPNGWGGLAINGTNMNGATNYEIDFLNHSSIGVSSGVLSGIENATDNAFI
jgi:hypothetical protein